MNYSVVIYILGWIMEIEAAFLALPGIVSAIYGEKGGFAFLWVALGSAVAGSAIILRKPKNMRFYLREGFVTVALSWILMSVIGCLPFVINGDIPHFADALFEMISGFTTTGATVVSDVEGLTKGSLFWRSFSHWIGGMGVLVFLLARADGGRQPHEPDEGGKPGTFGWKAGSEGASDSQISVYYLFCPDHDRGDFSTLWRNESV